MQLRRTALRRSLARVDYESLAAFRYALRRFLRFSEGAARDAGVTPQQHQALLAIHGFPGRRDATVGELAERLQVKHHSAVGLVDRLVAQALACRRRAAGDRRQVRVGVTARGRRVLAALSDSHRAELARLAPALRRVLSRLAADRRRP